MTTPNGRLMFSSSTSRLKLHDHSHSEHNHLFRPAPAFWWHVLAFLTFFFRSVGEVTGALTTQAVSIYVLLGTQATGHKPPLRYASRRACWKAGPCKFLECTGFAICQRGFIQSLRWQPGSPVFHDLLVIGPGFVPQSLKNIPCSLRIKHLVPCSCFQHRKKKIKA